MKFTRQHFFKRLKNNKKPVPRCAPLGMSLMVAALMFIGTNALGQDFCFDLTGFSSQTDNTELEKVIRTVEDNGGNSYAFAGVNGGFLDSNINTIVGKVDSTGSVLWIRTIDLAGAAVSSIEFPGSLMTTANRDVIVASNTGSLISPSPSGFGIARFDPNGNLVASARILNHHVAEVIERPNGRILVFATDVVGRPVFFRFSATLSFINGRELGIPATPLDQTILRSVISTSDGGFACVARRTGAPNTVLRVIKLRGNLSVQWIEELVTTSNETGVDLIELPNTNLLVVNNSGTCGNVPSIYVFHRFNRNNGNLLGSLDVSAGPDCPVINDMINVPTGGFLVVGHIFDGLKFTMYSAKFSSVGALQGSRTHWGTGSLGFGATPGIGGGFMLVGSNPFDATDLIGRFVKTNNVGLNCCSDPYPSTVVPRQYTFIPITPLAQPAIGFSGVPTATPLPYGDVDTFCIPAPTPRLAVEEDPILAEIYPNPARQDVTIQWDGLGEMGEVSLYDLSGRMIRRSRVNSELTTLDLSGLRSGVYFVVLNNGKQKLQKRLVIQP